MLFPALCTHTQLLRTSPKQAAIDLANITSNTPEIHAVDVFVATSIIENLTTAAITNEEVCVLFLRSLWKITSFHLCCFVIHTQPIHTPTMNRWGGATWRVLIIWYKSMMMWLHRVKMKDNLHQGKAQYKRFSIACNVVPTSFCNGWNRCGDSILRKWKKVTVWNLQRF